MNLFDVPVLFLIFNRLDTTKEVFEAIREIKPAKLYIAGDGPRILREKEVKDVTEIRNYVLSRIDWPCEVSTLFRDENLGCKKAVSSAITWFFNLEEEGIILEDDCLPNQSFFPYCKILLEKYRYDERVRHITGTNVKVRENIGDGSYYFSNFTHVWGWASWRRVWKDYDCELDLLDRFITLKLLPEIYNNKWVNNQLTANFTAIANGRIDTWDYQYLFLNFWNNGLTIFPNVNLIKNIGFGEGATHTTNAISNVANLETFCLDVIKHPSFFVPMKTVDINYLLQEIGFSYLTILKYFVKKIIGRG